MHIKWKAWPVPMLTPKFGHTTSQPITTHIQPNHALPNMPQSKLVSHMKCTYPVHPLVINLAMANPIQNCHGSSPDMPLIKHAWLGAYQATDGPHFHKPLSRCCPNLLLSPRHATPCLWFVWLAWIQGATSCTNHLEDQGCNIRWGGKDLEGIVHLGPTLKLIKSL